MQNLIPCRFHIEVEAVLKSEGLRATKQRLDIWDELCSTDNHRDIETILNDLQKKKINVINPMNGINTINNHQPERFMSWSLRT